ncbi:MAG: GNAT family N-acetyltransferase [Deltaproteobacteria bacterium]|nr:GNAT family N-acetyltransferase [Deltaproteobacteria bacterium]
MRIPVNIRTFNFPDDYAPVVGLWERSGPEIQVGRSDTPDEIAKKIQRDPDLFLVADFQEEIIGVVTGGYDGRRGMIYHMAVDKEYRQIGVGTALMETLEDRLREKGCLRSYLMVRKDNAATQFYEKQGWQALDIFMFGKDIQ